MEIIDQTYIIDSEPFTIDDIKKGGSVDTSFIEMYPWGDKLPSGMKAYYRTRNSPTRRDLALIVQGTKAAFQPLTSLEFKVNYYNKNDELVNTMESGKLSQAYTSVALHGEHITPDSGYESLIGTQQTGIPASAGVTKIRVVITITTSTETKEYTSMLINFESNGL